MTDKCIVIGLTGPTGAGKTEVSKMMSKLGCFVIDTDKIVHEMMETDETYIKKISSVFGKNILNENNTVSREKLRKIVFENHNTLKKLNEIAHPMIKEKVFDIVRKVKQSGKYDFIAIDAPLLFEASFDSNCDFTVGVIAPEDIRINRIINRDKISFEDAMKRIRAQNDDSFFKNNCDFILFENHEKSELLKEIDKLLCTIKEKANV